MAGQMTTLGSIAERQQFSRSGAKAAISAVISALTAVDPKLVIQTRQYHRLVWLGAAMPRLGLRIALARWATRRRKKLF